MDDRLLGDIDGIGERETRVLALLFALRRDCADLPYPVFSVDQAVAAVRAGTRATCEPGGAPNVAGAEAGPAPLCGHRAGGTAPTEEGATVVDATQPLERVRVVLSERGGRHRARPDLAPYRAWLDSPPPVSEVRVSSPLPAVVAGLVVAAVWLAALLWALGILP